MRPLYLLFCLGLLVNCKSSPHHQPVVAKKDTLKLPVAKRLQGQKMVHVFVALCDNKYQGIVPVPKAIGNGQDAGHNLYWGCNYGIKTYFKKSKRWKLVATYPRPASHIIERCVFRHAENNTWLVADAYDGEYIRLCTEDFLKSCAGIKTDSLTVAGQQIFMAGSANLVSYIGHDGLMDFALTGSFKTCDTLKREAIVLACISKNYFGPHIKATHASPLLWSTGLMAPEAYTLHDAVEAWIKNEPAETVRQRAAQAYSQYQNCSVKAARRLLVTGW
ncbi:hypothetical protein [Foetidibacter luteolus]|uniref:hypothetical protein n=1 Tax=Foetidibacter luteolus TaxID=2608880 RepID=UPI001A997F77|nr:hypothetical protein [Foetidibacter luteolus]